MKDPISWWRTSFDSAEIDLIKESILNEHISQGTKTQELEELLSNYLKIPHAIVTTSGSTALLMSMIALGINPGDEVIVPNRTWIATANAPLLAGAKIKLVDVLEDAQLMDVSKIEQEITKKTKAIIPVHLNGRSVDMDGIKAIAKKYDLFVVEDACQALFSKNKIGYLGTQSDIGCFSLGVTKLISTAQGGVLVMKDDSLYEKLKLIRNNGTLSVLAPSYSTLGLNFKFTDIQASMGIAQFSKLEDKIQHVNEVYSRYFEGLSDRDQVSVLRVDVKNGEIPLYTEAICKERDELVKYLNSMNIYPRLALPNINSASYIHSDQKFPNSDNFAKNGLFLPCGPTQSLNNIDQVIERIHKFKELQ
jgi:perosamine synthetase